MLWTKAVLRRTDVAGIFEVETLGVPKPGLVAALPGVRELHIGHAIVSRSVFVGLREAVRQMKALIREAAAK